MERGSFKEVPKAMSRPANTRLTEARTKSKAAPSAMMASFLRKRELIHCFHPPLAAFGHRFGYSVSQGHAEAYQRAGYRGTSEVLFTVILAGKVHGSLDDIVGFLGCAECIDHDSACTDKEIPRGFGCTEE